MNVVSNTMKIINVGGFGYTGCTAQADFLTDYEGVAGILADPTRNKNVLRAPYQEFGILKCELTLGGIVISKIKGSPHIASRETLRASLKGNLDFFSFPLEKSEELHMKMRSLLNKQYGDGYEIIVDQAIQELPTDYEKLPPLVLLSFVADSMKSWFNGLIDLVNKKPELVSVFGEKIDVLGLKNDPPGAYPLLATVIPDGISSAILRDPRDTNVNFNEGSNSFGNDIKAVRRHCDFYNAQILWSKKLIEEYTDIIAPVFFVHDFENFVNSKSHRDAYLKKMVGKRKKMRCNFKPEESSKNVGIYKKLPRTAIDTIEEKCMGSYTNFRMFLREREMLME